MSCCFLVFLLVLLLVLVLLLGPNDSYTFFHLIVLSLLTDTVGVSISPCLYVRFLDPTRQERNREHAKRSRIRKKFMLECLQEQLLAMRKQNMALRQVDRSPRASEASRGGSGCGSRRGRGFSSCAQSGKVDCPRMAPKIWLGLWLWLYEYNHTRYLWYDDEYKYSTTMADMSMTMTMAWYEYYYNMTWQYDLWLWYVCEYGCDHDYDCGMTMIRLIWAWVCRILR